MLRQGYSKRLDHKLKPREKIGSFKFDIISWFQICVHQSIKNIIEMAIFLSRDIDKGKFTATDTFAYYETVIDNKDVVLLTDCRIIYATKSDLFGGWQCEWTHRWAEILSISVLNDGIEMILRSKDGKSALKKMFGSSGHQKKILLIPVAYRRNRLAEVMERLRQRAE